MGQRNKEHNDADDNVDDLRGRAHLVLQCLAAVDKTAEQQSRKDTADRGACRDQTDCQPVKACIFKCRQRSDSMGELPVI